MTVPAYVISPSTASSLKPLRVMRIRMIPCLCDGRSLRLPHFRLAAHPTSKILRAPFSRSPSEAPVIYPNLQFFFGSGGHLLGMGPHFLLGEKIGVSFHHGLLGSGKIHV